MTIDFNNLPSHLSLAIVKKTEIFDFVRYAKTSKKASLIASNLKTPISWEVPRLYFQHRWSTAQESRINLFDNNSLVPHNTGDVKVHLAVEVLQFFEEVTNIDCMAVIEKLRSLYATVRELGFMNNVICSKENFNLLLKVGKCSTIFTYTRATLMNRYLSVDGVDKIDTIKGTFDIDDDTFFRLRTLNVDIFNDRVTCNGLNVFIKEWIDGRRQFNSIKIKTMESRYYPCILNGIHWMNISETTKYVPNVTRDQVLVVDIYPTMIYMYVKKCH